jgi:uncharacterized linocin/CFP29 family protein
VAHKYFARDDAPFGAEIWDKLDRAMIQAAKSQLVGRKLLEVEGPFGFGLKCVSLRDEETLEGLITSEVLPVPLIQEIFTLGLRDLATYEREPISLNASPVANAALEVARKEDRLVFYGAEDIPGLLTVEGAHHVDLSPWDEVGSPANDIINAVTRLDEAGFHGPYALALAPQLYNQLYHIYPNSGRSQLEHIKNIVTDGVYKAPVLEAGGVLVATSRLYASIVIGQDMSVGFIGPVGAEMELFVAESLAPRIRRPNAICVLGGAG